MVEQNTSCNTVNISFPVEWEHNERSVNYLSAEQKEKDVCVFKGESLVLQKSDQEKTSVITRPSLTVARSGRPWR